MHLPVRRCFLLLALLVLAGCAGSSPDRIVSVAVLNANQVTMFVQPAFFDEMRSLKRQGRIPVMRDGQMALDGTAVDYVRSTNLERVGAAIERVEQLSPRDDEARAIVEASLDLLRFGQDMFERDHMAIARMLDDGLPDAEIDAAIEDLFSRNGDALGEKSGRLAALAGPYADRHGIDLRVR